MAQALADKALILLEKKQTPEFDTLYALRPLKPNTSAGCSSKFEKVVGRKLFGKTDGNLVFINKQRKQDLCLTDFAILAKT